MLLKIVFYLFIISSSCGRAFNFLKNDGNREGRDPEF